MGRFQITSLTNKPSKCPNSYNELFLIELESISLMFYACIFCTKFWHQKLQSCVLGLKCFVAKIMYEKQTCKMLMKLTPGVLPNLMEIET